MQFHVMLQRCALAALIAACVTSASAQQWTRFRGPNGSGIAENAAIPAKWTKQDINWKVELPGVGHSSPVLWGEKIFLLSADPNTATRYVLCLAAEDGREIWRREFPSTPHHLHSRNSYASCTPAVDAERVYVAWSTPEHTMLVALDHQGNDVWDIDLGTWTSQHGFGTSPMLYDGMVILSNSQQAQQLDAGQKPGVSFVLAVDATSGKEVWRAPRTSVRVCYATPTVFEADGGKPELICASTAEGVYSLDPKTGRENWKTPDSLAMRVCSSPLVADGLIYGSTGSGGGGNYVVAVRPGESAEVVYSVKTGAPYVPTVVAKDGLAYLFGDKGIVSCIDVKTGDVYWRERLSSGFSGSPVIAGDTVFCADDEGTVFAIAADQQFTLLGENPLGEECRSTPAIAGGRMYVRTVSHLISIGGKSL